MTNPSEEKSLANKLIEKGTVKQQALSNTKHAFEHLKECAQQMMKDLRATVDAQSITIPVGYKDLGDYSIFLRFGDEIIIIHMHTNVFHFSRTEEVMKTSYVKQDINRSYVGVINIYNFISDSFKYNRTDDVGYLIARMFINKENHFFVEGKRQVGLLYNYFSTSVADKDSMKKVIEKAIDYSLDFDLLVQPYDFVKEISINEIQMAISTMKLKTGKRLGFKFNADSDN